MKVKASVTKKDATKEVMAELQRLQLAYVVSGGQIIQGEMRSRAQRRTGNLQNSIQTEAYVEDGVPQSETGPTASYAPYVEYGTGIFAEGGNGRQTPWVYKDEEGNFHRTVGMAAKPFAEPGFQAAIPKLNALAQRLLK